MMVAVDLMQELRRQKETAQFSKLYWKDNGIQTD